ncbi:hypothetical protein KZZ20_04430 [Methylacidiphilum fumariolicum]|nr:hypothetical protein [Candidatus Methylacidiphilum fumarolicum]MBW6414762.1 hypothetical protein [Candidatus Methylacidiphilum fumarolicum]
MPFSGSQRIVWYNSAFTDNLLVVFFFWRTASSLSLKFVGEVVILLFLIDPGKYRRIKNA